MDVPRTTTVAARAGTASARGLVYSVFFGLATWGVILGVVWLVRTLIG